MKRQVLFAFFASLMLMLSGCGSNDKIDSGSGTNANKAVTLETSIDSSGRDFNISAKITKATDFAVALKNFELLSVGGCEIESVSLPSDFKMAGGKGSYESVQFSGRFKNDCTPAGHTIKFTQTISDGSRSKTETVTYDSAASSGGSTGGGGSTTAPVNGFFNATTPLVITQASHDYNITIQVLEGGYAASGKTVKAKPFDRQYGSIGNPTIQTGVDGYAVFKYTSPQILPANGSSMTVTLTNDENGTLISQDIILQFSSNGGSQYNLINVSTPVRVTAPSETQEISVYVVDSTTLIGVPNKQVSITTIEKGYGSIDAASTSTDDAGKATFNYTSPADLTGLTRTTAILSFEENGVVLHQSVNIEVDTAAPTDKQSIQVLPLDSNVSVGSEAKPINVYVKDSTGRPAVDTSVVVEFFNAKYGAMNKYEEKTDSNGHIEFVYIAPSIIDALDGQMFDFNVSLKSDPSIVKTVRIGFHQAVNISPVSDIYIAPNDITIVRAGEERTIKITTVDSGNYAVSTNLKLENPTLNGKDYGSFNVSDFSTDALGNYLVTYTAPTSLSGLSERNISVVELSTNLTKTLTLHFQQPASTEISYNLDLSVDRSIKVDGSGTLGIKIHETGKPNDLIARADVKNVTAAMKFPKMLLFENNLTSITYTNENIGTYTLFAQHLSGVAVIEVVATVFNGVRDITLREEFPVVITSGPVSSMSMFHSRNSFDTGSGKYQDFYTIHAVDKYGNPVSKGTALHPTLINGVKEQQITGSIATGDPSVFSDDHADFSTVVDNAGATAGDRLIVLPSPTKTNKYYLGDWSIKDHTATTLTLDEKYDDVAANGLTYVVGNENRIVTINGQSVTATADISSPNDSFLTDAQGSMEFVVTYDPALKGKEFYLAANGPSSEKRIGTALKSSFFYGGYQLRSLINEISLTQPGDSFSTGFYMLDSVGKTYAGQYNVKIDNFDASKGGFSIDNTTHDFQYSAPSNPDEFNALIGTTYEFNLTVSETDETFETIRVHYTSDTDYTNYAISSAESNFTIGQADQEHALSFYVSDGSKAVANEEVRVEFIDPLKGSMVDYTAVTDISGRALFTYRAPSDLALLYNNPVTIHAYVSNKNTIQTSVTALFVQNNSYALTNENDITISYAGESKEIAVQVIKNGTPQAGETVVAQSIPVAYGTISNASVQTGADGYARFTYVAATPLTDVNTTLELLYTDPTGAEISTSVDINISAQAQAFDYNLTNETNVSITRAEQVEVVSVAVVDSTTGVGVAGKTVSISTLAAGYGNFASATATTNAAGLAEFSYQAPADLSAINLTQTNATLSLTENGVTISKIITLDFNETTVASEYNLTNENDITISYAGESKEIAVQVIKNGTPQAGETVVAQSIPVAYGTISNASVQTGADGYARFTYVAATPLTDVNTTLELLYTDPTGAEISTSVDINISAQAQISDYNLTNITTPIVVNYDSEIRAISVDIVDQNGIGKSNMDVSITAVNGVKYGSIVSASTVKSNSSGRAIFSYKAPDDVAAVDGETTTVAVMMTDNGTTVSRNIEITFHKIDQNISVPIVVIANTYKEINLTQNSQNVQMEVQVFEQGTNTPYTSGNVKVSLPNNVLQGVDVGSFSDYTVAIGSNGKAVFNYTGPQDLQTLIDNNESNATFSFFHETNPTQQESITVSYDLQAGYIPANYLLTTSSSDDKQTMGLKTLKTFTLYLKDDQGVLVDDVHVDEVNITSQNILVGKLVDAANNGSNETTLHFSGNGAVNSKSFSIQTYTRSGLLPVEISVGFTDANGDAQVRTIIMNVVVFSGPPTALSISYAGVEQNKTVAKYIEKFAVTVTDAYNNPVNTRPYIAVGAMVEYAVDGSSPIPGDRSTTSPRLWHGTLDPRGELEALGGHKAQLTTTSDVFNYVDIDNDKLVVFGAGYVYEALGKWDIDSIANQALTLKDDYYGMTRSDLGFAVGHNNRQNLCTTDQREYVGNMKSNNYQIDTNGHVLVEFEYDYHLTGKDMMVWANLTGFQADNNQTGRIGEAQKHTLRGNGLKAIPEDGYKVGKGKTVSGATFKIHHTNAPEWYDNGNFGWAVKSGSTCGWSIDDWSNLYDARTCYGPAYITFTLTAPVDKDCTFAIERINTAREFTGVSTH